MTIIMARNFWAERKIGYNYDFLIYNADPAPIRS